MGKSWQPWLVLLLLLVVAVVVARQLAPRQGVVDVDEQDPAMNAAIKEARDRWPEFVQAFNARRPGEVFSAKGPFGSDPEFMWVTVESIDRGTIQGKLDNDPSYVKGIKLGDNVQIKLDQLADWSYTDIDNHSHGDFTTKVLEARQAPPRKK